MYLRRPLFIFLQSTAILVVALLFSCNKFENIPKPDLGLAYFPLQVKAVTIYNVDSTVYNDFNNSVTTFQFLLKDTIVAKYIDAQGQEAFRIERYKKIASADWSFQKILSKKITNNRAEEFIDNRRYVRLVFPPNLQSTWNGNLYNDIGEWPHHITSIDQKMTIGTFTLDSTLSISQYDEVNLIREDVYSETYAKNIGLVIKEVKAIDKDISSGRTKRGYIYKMQLNSYK
jgi:hypothetical protein